MVLGVFKATPEQSAGMTQALSEGQSGLKREGIRSWVCADVMFRRIGGRGAAHPPHRRRSGRLHLLPHPVEVGTTSVPVSVVQGGRLPTTDRATLGWVDLQPDAPETRYKTATVAASPATLSSSMKNLDKCKARLVQAPMGGGGAHNSPRAPSNQRRARVLVSTTPWVLHFGPQPFRPWAGRRREGGYARVKRVRRGTMRHRPGIRQALCPLRTGAVGPPWLATLGREGQLFPTRQAGRAGQCPRQETPRNPK